jgi:hypothetical protein
MVISEKGRRELASVPNADGSIIFRAGPNAASKAAKTMQPIILARINNASNLPKLTQGGTSVQYGKNAHSRVRCK